MGRKRRLLHNPKFTVKNKNHPIMRDTSAHETKVTIQMEDFETIQDLTVEETKNIVKEVVPPPVFEVEEPKEAIKPMMKKKSVAKQSFPKPKTKKSVLNG
jgi:hypothetical protein